jgi:hypothetical protein
MGLAAARVRHPWVHDLPGPSARRIIMKSVNTLVLAVGLLASAALIGCETHHSDSSKSGPFSDKHSATTTTKNPVTGDVSSSTTEQKTSKNPITGSTSTKTETHTNP